MAAGGSGSAQGPLVFVGYGITARDWKYDDYAGIDVQGKIVVMLRKEPQQGDATSVFNGLQPSMHASFRQKIKNAREHGAAAVIVVNDDFDIQNQRKLQQKAWRQAVDKLTAAVEEFKQLTSLSDEAVKQSQSKLADLAQTVVQLRQAADSDAEALVDFRDAGRPEGEAAIPVFFCRRSVLDPILQRTLGTDLATVERQIDQGPTPHSRELTGWTAECQSSVVQVHQRVKNVVGVLEGAGALADETIVIGAHYDHLGRGGCDRRGDHNGADDNASGTSGVLEIARRLIRQPGAVASSPGVRGLCRRGVGAAGQRPVREGPSVPARQDRGHDQPGHDWAFAGRQADDRRNGQRGRIRRADRGTQHDLRVQDLEDAQRPGSERSRVVLSPESARAVLLHRRARRLPPADGRRRKKSTSTAC